MSSPTEESSLKINLITQSSSSYNNKSLDGDIIFVGDYIDLSKTSDAVVDLTEESSAKMNNLITQSSNDDDAKQNLVDGEGNHEIDTLDTLSSSSSSGEESILEGMKDDKSGADTNTGEYQASLGCK